MKKDFATYFLKPAPINLCSGHPQSSFGPREHCHAHRAWRGRPQQCECQPNRQTSQYCYAYGRDHNISPVWISTVQYGHRAFLSILLLASHYTERLKDEAIVRISSASCSDVSHSTFGLCANGFRIVPKSPIKRLEKPRCSPLASTATREIPMCARFILGTGQCPLSSETET